MFDLWVEGLQSVEYDVKKRRKYLIGVKKVKVAEQEKSKLQSRRDMLMLPKKKAETLEERNETGYFFAKELMVRQTLYISSKQWSVSIL